MFFFDQCVCIWLCVLCVICKCIMSKCIYVYTYVHILQATANRRQTVCLDSIHTNKHIQASTNGTPK